MILNLKSRPTSLLYTVCVNVRLEYFRMYNSVSRDLSSYSRKLGRKQPAVQPVCKLFLLLNHQRLHLGHAHLVAEGTLLQVVHATLAIYMEAVTSGYLRFLWNIIKELFIQFIYYILVSSNNKIPRLLGF